MPRLAAVKRCYEDHLAANPSLAGKVVARWTIDSRGATTDVAIDSQTIPEPAVGACLVGLIKTWRFRGPPHDSVTVSFPFVFQASP